MNSLLDGKKIDSITRMRQGARGTRGMEKNKISFVKDTIKERDFYVDFSMFRTMVLHLVLVLIIKSDLV